MNNTRLAKCISDINSKTFGGIIYVSPSSERAVGIEELIENYHIIDGSNNNYTSRLLSKKGIKTLSLGYETTDKLLKNDKLKEYLQNNKINNPYLMVFKNTQLIEKAGFFKLLSTNARLGMEIEDKISQYKLLSRGGFKEYLPKTILSRIDNLNMNNILDNLGNRVICQFDRGHTGNSTFLVDGKLQLNNFVNRYTKSGRMVKFSAYIPSEYYTINAVSTSNGTFCGGLCNQLTGLTQIGARRFESCGNNWNQTGLSEDSRKRIIKLTEEVGNYLYLNKFRGIFGIDFAISSSEENIYIIEINPRQTTSIQNLSKIQLDTGEIPLLVIHLMEFLNIDYYINQSEYNLKNNAPYNASSLIIRNNEDREINITEDLNGIFDIESMGKKEDGYSISDLYSSSQILILTNEKIPISGEITKIIAKGNIMKNINEIDENILKFINRIKTIKV